MSPLGRPKKDKAESKNHRLEIRLTDAENNMLNELALKLNLSKTEVILQALSFLAKK